MPLFDAAYWRTRFPEHKPGLTKTSDPDDAYNCIAWAAGVTTEWWSDHYPEYPWPGDRKQGRIEGLVSVFAGRGFSDCGANGQLEPGYDKVALYANSNGFWKHAARQLPDGSWTTKDGWSADITHTTPECVCPEYGSVYCFMKKKINDEPASQTTQREADQPQAADTRSGNAEGAQYATA